MLFDFSFLEPVPMEIFGESFKAQILCGTSDTLSTSHEEILLMDIRFSRKRMTFKDFIRHKEQTISASRQWILLTKKKYEKPLNRCHCNGIQM